MPVQPVVPVRTRPDSPLDKMSILKAPRTDSEGKCPVPPAQLLCTCFSAQQLGERPPHQRVPSAHGVVLTES